jgi:hypothetical protein
MVRTGSPQLLDTSDQKRATTMAALVGIAVKARLRLAKVETRSLVWIQVTRRGPLQWQHWWGLP